MNEEVNINVELGQYRGLTAKKKTVVVDRFDIDLEIEKLLEARAGTKMTIDRAVAPGDKAVIDFEGFLDGKPFAGGKGVSYPLEIGSHSFIDTFEEQLIGVLPGQRVEVHVTFPTDYGSAELAGKPAMFLVDVRGILDNEELELNDEVVRKEFGFDSVEAFRDALGKRILAAKELQAEEERRQVLLAMAVDNAQIELPEALIRDAIRQMLEQIEMNMKQQGMTMEQGLKASGMTMEKLIGQIRPQAISEAKTRLVLEAIVKEEDFLVTEAEIEEQLEGFANQYRIPLEQVKKMMEGKNMELVKGDIRAHKAMQLIVDTAQE